MTEGILDALGWNGFQAMVRWVMVEMVMEWGFGGGAPLLEAQGDAA